MTCEVVESSGITALLSALLSALLNTSLLAQFQVQLRELQARNENIPLTVDHVSFFVQVQVREHPADTPKDGE
jgi:hypothetical protein